MCEENEREAMVDSKKQKILIVHNYYQIPGGEDTVVTNEKRLLEEHGHEVILYSKNNSELKIMGKVQKMLLPLITVFNLRSFRDVKRIIKEHRIDIVHVHNTLNIISPSVYYAARVCKVPVVQTVHNFRLLCPGATFYRDDHICEDCVDHGLFCSVKHSCYRNSKLQTLACVISTKFHRMTGIYGKINYISLTEFNREKLLQLNRPGKKQIVDPDRIFIKPNFTFENTSEMFGRDNEYFLYSGRVEKIKGLDILLDAFAQLSDEKLIVAGTGTQVEEYKDKATKNVEFKGFLNREKLAECLSRAKAVIVPSQWYETFGMIIAEAYAAHKPIIVGNIGNLSSLVDKGLTGITFTYNSAEALSDAVMQFENIDTNGWGENAYRKYKDEFSPESNYYTLRGIYDSVRN